MLIRIANARFAELLMHDIEHIHKKPSTLVSNGLRTS